MKTRLLLSLVVLGCCAAQLQAKTLKIKLVGLRSDTGFVLAAAAATGGAKPLYARTAPEQGCAHLTFDTEADSLAVSIFHDENGNYRLDREEGRPAEGCLHLTIALPDAQNTAELELRYDFAPADAEKTK